MTDKVMTWEDFETAIHVLAHEIEKSGVEISTIYGINYRTWFKR
jgi:hypoxanthine phosphoribosyltransferase